MEKRKIFFSRIKRRFLKRVWLVRTVLVVSLVLALFLLFLLGDFIFRTTGLSTYTSFARDFVFPSRQEIMSLEGRTNFLLLGKGGAGHDAPDLTDTIIFVSVGFTHPRVTLVSLPRDIWLPQLRAKLNSAYYWGNQKDPGGGLILAKSSAEEIIGQPVNYGVVIDFEGFREVINAVGGIEIEVERSFTDERYPIPGRENDDCGDDPEFKCRYETLHFEKGRQIMDGTTALKFVRSRNAEGDEGTDLARAARQQKVLASLKDKVLSWPVLLHPGKVQSLMRIARENIETDMTSREQAILARALFNARGDLRSSVLPEDLLLVPPVSSRYDNLYVFLPQGGDWNGVHAFIENLLP